MLRVQQAEEKSFWLAQTSSPKATFLLLAPATLFAFCGVFQ
jgi:hypothetical protein